MNLSLPRASHWRAVFSSLPGRTQSQHVSMRLALLPVLWAVAVYALLSACALRLTDAYGHAVLPFYRWELSWIAPEYEVQKLEVDGSDPQPMFRTTALDTQYMFVNGRLQPPGTVAYMSHVLVMSGLQPIVLVFFVPLAWPGLTWRRRVASVVCAIPVLCALEFVDIPWSLIGGLDAAKADMTRTSETFAMICGALLSTGGRLSLGLAGGVLAFQMSTILENSRLRKLRRGKPGKRSASKGVRG
jgi:hypothetical protein